MIEFLLISGPVCLLCGLIGMFYAVEEYNVSYKKGVTWGFFLMFLLVPKVKDFYSNEEVPNALYFLKFVFFLAVAYCWYEVL